MIAEEERPWQELPEMPQPLIRTLAEEVIRFRQALEQTRENLMRMRFPATEILDFRGFREALQQMRHEVQQLRDAVFQERGEQARREVLQRVLDTVDALDRFEEAVQKAREEARLPAEVENWIQGFAGIAYLLKEALRGLGVREIPTIGHRFDPYRHLAVGTVTVQEQVEDGIIIKERRKGYMLGDKVLRPAEVIVARKEGVSQDA